MHGIFLQATVTVADTLTKLPQVTLPKEANLTLWDLAVKGGIVMIPIGLLMLMTVYIFIERYIVINRAAREDVNFMNNMRDFIHTGRIDSGLALCRNNTSPIAKMIEKGLHRLGRPLNDIQTAIENVGSLEISKLEKNLALLATAAGSAPMLGFLGTVTGMVRAFHDMAIAGTEINIQLLSHGIYEAMITTVAGLIVGIIAYFLYNYLATRIHKIVFKLEANSVEFMDLLHEPAKTTL